ncbi:hypothetical protein FB451DRAFT_1409629 [Mycena latifolia]|nr:hypothetical protein FB451DRAFT_1409629 [Mycena latifolia]
MRGSCGAPHTEAFPLVAASAGVANTIPCRRLRSLPPKRRPHRQDVPVSWIWRVQDVFSRSEHLARHIRAIPRWLIAIFAPISPSLRYAVPSPPAPSSTPPLPCALPSPSPSPPLPHRPRIACPPHDTPRSHPGQPLRYCSHP